MKENQLEKEWMHIRQILQQESADLIRKAMKFKEAKDEVLRQLLNSSEEAFNIQLKQQELDAHLA